PGCAVRGDGGLRRGACAATPRRAEEVVAATTLDEHVLDARRLGAARVAARADVDAVVTVEVEAERAGGDLVGPVRSDDLERPDLSVPAPAAGASTAAAGPVVEVDVELHRGRKAGRRDRRQGSELRPAGGCEGTARGGEGGVA